MILAWAGPFNQGECISLISLSIFIEITNTFPTHAATTLTISQIFIIGISEIRPFDMY